MCSEPPGRRHRGYQPPPSAPYGQPPGPRGPYEEEPPEDLYQPRHWQPQQLSLSSDARPSNGTASIAYVTAVNADRPASSLLNHA
jgi:hypothetical protein